VIRLLRSQYIHLISNGSYEIQPKNGVESLGVRRPSPEVQPVFKNFNVYGDQTTWQRREIFPGSLGCGSPITQSTDFGGKEII